MNSQVLISVFANAATPQKVVLLALMAAVVLILVGAALAPRLGTRGEVWRRLIAALRVGGPALGLLVGAMDSFHMARTIQRIPVEATAKQLAPGILEVSALIGLGALVGLMALAAGCLLGATSAARARLP
jgi:nucleoside recognition membrane protein YjiH